jgi:hypothetical protein
MNLHEALLQVKADHTETGICDNLYMLGCEHKINSLAMEWPKYSGCFWFPVPGPEGYLASEAYQNLPKWEGPYGDLRKELLDFLIERTNPTKLCHNHKP